MPPLALYPPRIPRFPIWSAWILIPVGMLLVGWGLNDHSPLSSGTLRRGAMTVTERGTRQVTTTETVKRVVHGKVIHLPGEQTVLRIPVIIVKTEHHKVVVPAHNVPILSAAAVIAHPRVPVTVYVQVPTTVYADPVTTTATVTVTSTEIVPTTVTVTLPPETG